MQTQRKGKKGRRQDRGQTELKHPRQPAASVINNVCPICDGRTERQPGRGYATRQTLQLLTQDTVLKYLKTLILSSSRRSPSLCLFSRRPTVSLMRNPTTL